MDAVSNALLTLLGRALFSARGGALPEDTDWAALYRESCAQAVHLLTYDCLYPGERACLPPEVGAQWKQAAMLTLQNNERVQREQQTVLGALRGGGVPCVILKGSSSAMCYPRPELRCAGDIDILVSGQELEMAEALLEGLGYSASAAEHHCHVAMSRGRMVAELHFEPNGIPDGDVGQSIREFFSGAEREPDDWNGIPVLPTGRRAVVMLLHMLRHILDSGMGLRQLCDWAVFVKAELSPEAWDELRPTLARFGLLRFAEIVTRVCVEHLALPSECAPWCLGVDAQFSDTLISDFLTCGNFGMKEDRSSLRYFTDIGSSGRISSAWKVGIATCRSRWPVCERHPVLLPAAPAVLLFRYIRQRSSGQRPKLHLLNAYKNAAPNQRLYQEFAPFQPESAEEK